MENSFRGGGLGEHRVALSAKRKKSGMQSGELRAGCTLEELD